MAERLPDLPNIKPALLDLPTIGKLEPAGDLNHPPRILVHFGAEVKIFDPTELPMAGSAPEAHPKVVELRELCLWSEGQVWCSPERHGAVTAVMKNQIDWIPLDMGAIRPNQGRTRNSTRPAACARQATTTASST